MKNTFFILLICWINAAVANVEMTRVNPQLLIHQAKENFDSISLSNETLKQTMVKYLFDNDLIDHIGTKAYDTDAKFSNYYKQFHALYRLIDLNNDGIPELIFNGFVAEGDDREYLQIFNSKQGVVEQVYNEIGHLIAYKIQPNTKEILLYHHQYPCCVNASHNLNRLRWINGKFQMLKRYFLGRDHDMVGPFLPLKSQFTGIFNVLSNKTKLYWSPAVIEKDAWLSRSATNVIATYDSLTVYTVLAKVNNWKFVLMKGAPIIQKSVIINPANFTSTWIYGWIKEE